MPKVGNIELPFSSNVVSITTKDGRDLCWKLDFMSSKNGETLNLLVNALQDGKFCYVGIISTEEGRAGSLVQTQNARRNFWGGKGFQWTQHMVSMLWNGEGSKFSIKEYVSKSENTKKAEKPRSFANWLAGLSDKQFELLTTAFVAEYERRNPSDVAERA